MGVLRLAVAVGLAAIGACYWPGTSGEPTGSAERPRPRDMRHYQADWRRVSDGRAPSEWVEIQEDGHQRPWLYDGDWQIRRVDHRAILALPTANTDLAEPLSFLRYNGGAFGPFGHLPARYRVVLEGRSLGGAARFNGYGELASQVFYLSPESYVEVLQTDEHFFIWQADQAPPMQGSGWQQLAKVPNPVRVGEWVRFGAEVDRREGRIVAFLNDQPVATASPSLLRPGSEPRLTLRATGNREEWRVVEIQELP